MNPPSRPSTSLPTLHSRPPNNRGAFSTTQTLSSQLSNYLLVTTDPRLSVCWSLDNRFRGIRQDKACESNKTTTLTEKLLSFIGLGTRANTSFYRRPGRALVGFQPRYNLSLSLIQKKNGLLSPLPLHDIRRPAVFSPQADGPGLISCRVYRLVSSRPLSLSLPFSLSLLLRVVRLGG